MYNDAIRLRPFSAVYHVQTVNDIRLAVKIVKYNPKSEEKTYQCIHVKFKRLWHRRSTTNVRNVILKLKPTKTFDFSLCFELKCYILLVFSVYCAFVHCINDTRMFEYDRLICHVKTD